MPAPDSLSWIADEAHRLRDRGLLHGRSWSLAQVCEHLALAIRGTVDAPSSESTWRKDHRPLGRLKRRVIKRVLLLAGRFPAGIPAPKFVIPSDSPDLDAAMRLLGAAAADFDRKLAEPDARWMDHPLLGPMSGRQWRRFHEVHARHHFRVVRAQPSTRQ